jgi:omega-6 fatty acid desaturase (delta-12 desaturase)
MQFPSYSDLAGQIETQRSNIREILNQYSRPNISRSVWQMINTLVPFFAMWALAAYVFKNYSFWWMLPVTVLAAGFMVRAFIIFHDCCHGSYFQRKAANDIVGRMLGIIVFTPYDYWKHDHAVHHASAGNLDKRGVGDVPTWTIEEYESKPWYARMGYRLMRHPVILFTFVAFYVFAISHRFWLPGVGRREKESVIFTNLGIAAVLGVLTWLLGWQTVLAVQLPVLMMAAVGGLWLFYVQHNFEDTYWERQENWDFYKAGLLGSSYYQLPAILNWFTGNIGFHHIHHLSPKIPNYNLPKVHRQHEIFQQVKPLTMWRSLKSLTYRLWDEEKQAMVGFNVLRNRRNTQQGGA